MTDRRKLALLLPGLSLLALLVLAYGAPWIAPHDPIAMDVAGRLKPPSADHWLGQDEYGRDILSRLLYGARVSLSVAIIASLAAMVIGVTLGLVGGYFRGLAEIFTLRLVDIVLSFPPILLALLIVTLFGPGAVTLTACLSVLLAPGFARVTYGEVLSISQLDYVEAVRALGAGSPRIVLKTVLPNVAGPILVQLSLTVASAILIESGLSFLGLGVIPPDPSWGLMIRGARGYMNYSAMGLIWPCLALIVTVLIFNAMCDAMRDLFDPRARPVDSAAVAAALPDRTALADHADETRADNILEVKDLATHIMTERGVVKAVDGVSFSLVPGETLAVVGESGSGKSMTGLSIMGLLPEPAGYIARGSIRLRRRDGSALHVETASDEELRSIRGDDVAMIFQEPMTALNPVYRIGDQITEAIRQHRDITRKEARRLAVNALDKVGIPDPATRIDAFPHELSGGMRQRAMIAMALALEPALLIADEPTTALDVTIQAQILELLKSLQRTSDPPLAMIFITHNLGVVAELADRVMVVYAGDVVEEGPMREVFDHPRHPYTRGLLDSVPRPGSRERLRAIAGVVPSPFDRPAGCHFAPRCALARDLCRRDAPQLVETAPGHRSRCHFWQEVT
ncbi:MAG: dipeptide/oligopeptide/nickel ABC transporter permease/ATP-binding protein [Geminicoccaceae bacterium]|nr:dipeptide/oligopeptide/nickel ABC transporter permease/ATP-binding protein [Geminicoccaceae bacterium]